MLIALYSYAQQSGKDTAADIIHDWCQDQGLTYQRIAFADKMKLLVGEVLGLSIRGNKPHQEIINSVDEFKLHGSLDWYAFNSTSAPETTIGGRDFIIAVAEGCRHLFGENFWTEQCITNEIINNAQVTVITDLSFMDEANRVHQYMGKVIEVIRPGFERPRTKQGKLDPQYIDAVLWNDWSLKEYNQNVKNFMNIIYNSNA